MTRNLTSIQITLILGGILLVACLLILLAYLLHKAFQRQRKQTGFGAARPRSTDEAAFVSATVQGVIAKMKAREKEMNNLLRDAEQRAETSSRTLETIVREFPSGLMIFDREGFLTLANPPARAILGIDLWSRRRYTKILDSAPPIVGLVRGCLEKGTNRCDQFIDITTPGGSAQALRIIVSPCQGRGGQQEGVVCMVAKRK